MKVITVANVNYALNEGLAYLSQHGHFDQSRNGPVLVAPGPVCTVYLNPDQRVLFSAVRDANPFFHLMESLWMLAGRNDVDFVKYYAGNMAQFSDDTKTLHGAYGYRWRESMGYDQLPVIIAELRKNPQSRRCVLQMWDATCIQQESDTDVWNVGSYDLNMAMSGGKDVPCNTHVYFSTNHNVLDMTVCNRSNDVVWGAYGANCVHMSMLMEYVARGAGLEMGTYYQFSNNYHVYSERPDVKKLIGRGPIVAPGVTDDRYAVLNFTEQYPDPTVSPYPIMQHGAAEFDQDLEYFFGMWAPGGIMLRSAYINDFFGDVVVPIVNAHHCYKADDFDGAYLNLTCCAAEDWRVACSEWLQRRQANRAARLS